MENVTRILWKLSKEFQKETENAERILKKKKKKRESFKRCLECLDL